MRHLTYHADREYVSVYAQPSSVEQAPICPRREGQKPTTHGFGCHRPGKPGVKLSGIRGESRPGAANPRQERPGEIPDEVPACHETGECLHFQPKPLFGRGRLMAWAP